MKWNKQDTKFITYMVLTCLVLLVLIGIEGFVETLIN